MTCSLIQEVMVMLASLLAMINDDSDRDFVTALNCAEIWAARELILQGCSFDELILNTYHYSTKNMGSVDDWCANCTITFDAIAKNLGG